jgi:CubicO group peptidase (beta-lactamase class C family)
MRRMILGGGAALAVGGLAFGLSPIVDRGLSASVPQAMPEEALRGANGILDFAAHQAQGIDALVIHRGTAMVLAYGPVHRPMNLGSVRKSVLSLLYGIALDRGLVDLDQTLAELGIDESRTPLTETEKSATLAQLLQSRSGVYLPAGGEGETAELTRPERGSARPGEQFYYNNWDFNVAGVVFERKTGMTIGAALNEWLAKPLGMEDFHPSHVFFDSAGGLSDYPTYRIFLSARDLARIGTLVRNGGTWQGAEVVSTAWLDRSLAPLSRAGAELSEPPYDGFGYSWWINTATGDVMAAGWGGQYLYVDRVGDLTLVARKDTGNSPLGHLWFQTVETPGRFQDVLTLVEMAREESR